MTKMYDQTTGELCGKCGWSMKFPDEPCRCELERENAALRADKERLDFLGQTKCAYYYEGPCCWRINEDKNTDGDTLRDAIDAARKEVQP